MSLRNLGLNSAFSSFFKKSKDLNQTVETVLDFRNATEESMKKIMTRSDKELGGYSTAAFDVDKEAKAGHFHGYLSLDLPKENPEVVRSGYAMFRTKDQQDSLLFGDSYWDWSPYEALVLRVRGDRRKYLVNIQANTPKMTDLYQHRLFLNTPGQWETVVIPIDDFVITNWGVIQDSNELNKLEIKTFGVDLLDKQYGPYSLQIDWVKVMTGAEVEKVTKDSRSTLVSGKLQEKDTNRPRDQGEAAFPTDSPQDPKDTVF